MNRITLPGEPPSVQECVLCDNNHDCWGCSKFEEIVQRLWELENKEESTENIIAKQLNTLINQLDALINEEDTDAKP